MGEFICNRERDTVDGEWFDFLEMLEFTVADAKNTNTGFLRMNFHKALLVVV